MTTDYCDVTSPYVSGHYTSAVSAQRNPGRGSRGLKSKPLVDRYFYGPHTSEEWSPLTVGRRQWPRHQSQLQ